VEKKGAKMRGTKSAVKNFISSENRRLRETTRKKKEVRNLFTTIWGGKNLGKPTLWVAHEFNPILRYFTSSERERGTRETIALKKSEKGE